MRLIDWVKERGKGEQARLKRATGLSYTTIQALVYGRQAAKYETGKLIETATDGAVSVTEVCELPPVKTPRRSAASNNNGRKKKRKAS